MLLTCGYNNGGMIVLCSSLCCGFVGDIFNLLSPILYITN